MPIRFGIFCLALLITSCDRESVSAEDDAKVDQKKSPPAITKLPRTEEAKPVLSEQRLQESLKALEKIASLEERERAIASLAWDYAEENLNLALETMDHLTVDSPERKSLIEHFAMRFAEQDIEHSILWAQNLKSPEEISIALGRVSLVIAATDPSRAAHLISESAMVGRPFDVAVVQIIQRWATKNPAEAAAWVQSFEPSAARTAGIQQTIAQWAEMDRPAAIAWVNGLTDKSLREDAVLAMADFILAQPQKTQDEWAEKIPSGLALELLNRKTEEKAPVHR